MILPVVLPLILKIVRKPPNCLLAPGGSKIFEFKLRSPPRRKQSRDQLGLAAIKTVYFQFSRRMHAFASKINLIDGIHQLPNFLHKKSPLKDTQDRIFGDDKKPAVLTEHCSACSTAINHRVLRTALNCDQVRRLLVSLQVADLLNLGY